MKPEQTPTRERITYPNASGLQRKQKLSGNAIVSILVGIVLAACLGGFAIYKTADTLFFSVEREQKQIEANIARSIDYGFPNGISLCTKTSDEALAHLAELGKTLYYFSTEADYPDGGFDVFAIPNDVSEDQAKEALSNGISRMSALDASMMLNGAYRVTYDLSNYHDLRIRYSDFKSTSYDEALDAAQLAQNLSGDLFELVDEGTDNYGNHFRSGIYDKEGANIEWRISVIDLNNVYDIKGLPENAYYVGIRFVSK